LFQQAKIGVQVLRVPENRRQEIWTEVGS
jgi:hypothetical protein